MTRMAALLTVGAAAALAAAASRSPEPNPAAVERGRYVVERVAMCVQCHTPRDAEGELQLDHLLQGAPIPVRSPAFARQGWAIQAPNIAGLTAYDHDSAVRLLMEGIARNGERLRPPMPQYRLSREDAEAVVAYLTSLR